MSVHGSRHLRIRSWLSGVVVLLGVQAACASAVPAHDDIDGAERISPELAEATFDSVWSQIRRTYYDSTFGGLDWEEVRVELRPRAASAGTNPELRRVLHEMLGRLGDSHFGVIPGELSEALTPEGTGGLSGDVGLEVRWIDETLVVTRVVGGGAAAEAGVRPGWAVMAVQGQEVDDWVSQADLDQVPGRLPSIQIQMVARAAGMLTGEEGSEVHIDVLDPQDRRIPLELERRRRAGEPVRIGNLPTMFTELDHDRRHLSDGEGCVGVIRFNVWMPPMAQPLLRALDEHSDCRGIVLDLRGNLGGFLAMVPAVSGALLEERALIGTLLTRDQATEFYSTPRRATFDGMPTRPFAGAVAVLVDELTVSAAEIFTAGLQANGRARVFGTRTAGEVLPSQTTRLPNGDVLLHAFADFTDPEGSRLEGSGVIPDEAAVSSRADLLAGRDRPLEAALRWIVAADVEGGSGG